MKQIQKINSWRAYSKVSGNRISVEVPKNFDAQEVELIIIPIKRKPSMDNKSEREGWKSDFMKISRWDISEEDIRMKSWRIPEF